MKRALLIICVVCALGFSVKAGTPIVLQGHYQGKNLYVQNPFSSSGVGFCVYEVDINGQVSSDEINSSAFEIDFTAMQLKVGDPVIVKIKHKDGCMPKVLNPEVLEPKSTFDVSSIKADNTGNLTWTTSNETGALNYIVEQFRWNKWVKAGEVMGDGTPGSHTYSFKLTPYSGENTVRVKQVDYSGKPRYSPSAKFTSTAPKVTFSPIKVKKDILFTDSTLYEIYDSYGNIVKRGYGKDVDASNLKKGIYYINYDNSTGDTFVKK